MWQRLNSSVRKYTRNLFLFLAKTLQKRHKHFDKKYHSSHLWAVKSVWLCSKFKNSWTIFLFYLVLNRRVEFHSWRRNINQPISKLKSVLQWGLGSVTPVSSGRKTTTTWKRGLQWDLDRWIKMGDWKIKTTPGKLNIL